MQSLSTNSPIILITGATRGIGFAAATQLVARGAHVIIASRDGARAAQAASSIGNNVSSVEIDITDAEKIRAAVETIGSQHERLDVLVNNAGILLDDATDLLSLNTDVLRATLETNLIGTFQVTKAFVPLLRKSPRARIINVSSRAGQLEGEPQAWAPAYSISKTALNMLTQQLTTALPEIAVNSMCPGWCRTAMGGDAAPRAAETGAETITWLALEASPSIRGGFYRDRAKLDW
jgi:NAD(P)-dependent dehydrogenase (short-subunit alcohol dehydrogenase family)